MPKTAYYPNWGSSPEYGAALYAIIENCCYFTGTQQGVTSTINAAESILLAIAATEHVPVTALRFFDLQAHQGYSSYPSGTYDLDELIFRKKRFRNEIKVEAWIPTECPPEVVELFRQQVGELDPHTRIWTPEEALIAGYVPGETHSKNPGHCFLIMGSYRRSAQLTRQLFVQSPALADQFGVTISDATIVVDQTDHPEYLARSQGDRFCMWRRNVTPDN